MLVRHDGPPTGSIPAQAGEPSTIACSSRQTKVYPRAGGGTSWIIELAELHTGLSPRRRGNQKRRWRPQAWPGSIPAQAGEPCWSGSPTSREVGLSPRRRGNPNPGSRLAARSGSIPAQAGEPSTIACSSRQTKVYPRAGGGTSWIIELAELHTGLSPRRRGNPAGLDPNQSRSGSIPAQAGEPASAGANSKAAGVYPRAGGGTQTVLSWDDYDQGLSPRRRGNRVPRHVLAPCQGLSPRRRGNPHDVRQHIGIYGSIPAQAGEPHSSETTPPGYRVYPRAGGGTLRS